MEYYSALNKKEILKYAKTWVNLEGTDEKRIELLSSN